MYSKEAFVHSEKALHDIVKACYIRNLGLTLPAQNCVSIPTTHLHIEKRGPFFLPEPWYGYYIYLPRTSPRVSWMTKPMKESGVEFVVPLIRHLLEVPFHTDCRGLLLANI